MTDERLMEIVGKIQDVSQDLWGETIDAAMDLDTRRLGAIKQEAIVLNKITKMIKQIMEYRASNDEDGL